MKDQQEGLPWAICCNPLWKLPEIKEHIAAPGWEPWGTGEHNQRIIDHKHELCAEMRLLSALLARGEEVLKAEILLRLLSGTSWRPQRFHDYFLLQAQNWGMFYGENNLVAGAKRGFTCSTLFSEN